MPPGGLRGGKGCLVRTPEARVEGISGLVGWLALRGEATLLEGSRGGNWWPCWAAHVEGRGATSTTQAVGRAPESGMEEESSCAMRGNETPKEGGMNCRGQEKIRMGTFEMVHSNRCLSWVSISQTSATWASVLAVPYKSPSPSLDRHPMIQNLTD